MDLPGFDRNGIKLRLRANILSARAEKLKGGSGGGIGGLQPEAPRDREESGAAGKDRGEAAEAARLAGGVLAAVIPFTGPART